MIAISVATLTTIAPTISTLDNIMKPATTSMNNDNDASISNVDNKTYHTSVNQCSLLNEARHNLNTQATDCMRFIHTARHAHSLGAAARCARPTCAWRSGTTRTSAARGRRLTASGGSRAPGRPPSRGSSGCRDSWTACGLLGDRQTGRWVGRQIGR